MTNEEYFIFLKREYYLKRVSIALILTIPIAWGIIFFNLLGLQTQNFGIYYFIAFAIIWLPLVLCSRFTKCPQCGKLFHGGLKMPSGNLNEWKRLSGQKCAYCSLEIKKLEK